MKQFWCIWNSARGVPTKKHDNWEEAQQEAKRLSIMYPEDEFHILMSVGTYKSSISPRYRSHE